MNFSKKHIKHYAVKLEFMLKSIGISMKEKNSKFRCRSAYAILQDLGSKWNELRGDNMCEFCEDKIYKDSEGNFFLEVETLEWDDYYDCYEKVALSGIKYCPFCGRELGDEDTEVEND